MTVFIAVTGATVAFANQYKTAVPDPGNVKMAYVGSDRWVYNYIDELDEDMFNSRDEFLKWQKGRGLIFFTEKETIEDITRLHKELISNQYYSYEQYYMNNIVISYLMDDGSVIIRDYKVDNTKGDNSFNEKKDEIAYEILNSNEMKKNKYYYLFDEENYNSENIYCYVTYTDQEGIAVDNIDFEEIKEYLIKDVENDSLNMENAFEPLAIYYYDQIMEKEYGGRYYLQIIDKRIDSETESNSIDGISLNNFENTMKYLNIN